MCTVVPGWEVSGRLHSYGQLCHAAVRGDAGKEGECHCWWRRRQLLSTVVVFRWTTGRSKSSTTGHVGVGGVSTGPGTQATQEGAFNLLIERVSRSHTCNNILVNEVTNCSITLLPCRNVLNIPPTTGCIVSKVCSIFIRRPVQSPRQSAGLVFLC